MFIRLEKSNKIVGEMSRKCGEGQILIVSAMLDRLGKYTMIPLELYIEAPYVAQCLRPVRHDSLLKGCFFIMKIIFQLCLVSILKIKLELLLNLKINFL